MKRDPFPFQGLRPPSPPEGLKQCVLLAARGAAPAGDPSLVDRIWESGWVRLSAAVLFATLLALHFRLHSPSVPSNHPPSFRADAGTIRVEGMSLADPRPGSTQQWSELFLEVEMGPRDERGDHR